MTKREECWTLELLVETVSDVDVFAIKNAATLRAVAEERRVVFKADREGEWKFTGLNTISRRRRKSPWEIDETTLTGLTFPNRTSAIALPVSLPPYQACTTAPACSAQGIVTGVPL
jgi:hypothetical protein